MPPGFMKAICAPGAPASKASATAAPMADSPPAAAVRDNGMASRPTIRFASGAAFLSVRATSPAMAGSGFSDGRTSRLSR